MLYHPRGRQEILQVLIRVGDGGEVHEVPVQRPLVLHRLGDLSHSLVLCDGPDDRRVLVQHPLDICRIWRRPRPWPRSVVVDDPGLSGRRGAVVPTRRMSVRVLPRVAGRRGAMVSAYGTFISRVCHCHPHFSYTHCKCSTLKIYNPSTFLALLQASPLTMPHM